MLGSLLYVLSHPRLLDSLSPPSHTLAHPSTLLHTAHFYISLSQVSSGTTWPVIMRSPSSARTLRVIWPSLGRPSPTSEYLEDVRAKRSITTNLYLTIYYCYLLLWPGPGPGVLPAPARPVALYLYQFSRCSNEINKYSELFSFIVYNLFIISQS